MKKIYTTAVILLTAIQLSFGQWTQSGSNITTPNSVGIGTTTPQGNLDIFTSTNTGNTPLFSLRSNFHVIGNYGMIRFGDYTQTTNYQKGAIIYESVAGSARGRFHIALENTDGTGSVTLADAKLTVLSNGNVGIGTTTPQESLSVNGNIRSKQVKVETANWPDFVFKPVYQLRPLDELKAYIDRNQHLPDIPSATEIETDGQNLGEMNKLLLKKVEELTLYLIAQDKEIKDLKSSQQSQIDALKTQMEILNKPNHQ